MKLSWPPPNNSIDDKLYEKGKELNLNIVRGSEDDVLGRFFEASKVTDANIFIRVTADCPFIDKFLIEDLINEFLKQKGRLFIKLLSTKTA